MKVASESIASNKLIIIIVKIKENIREITIPCPSNVSIEPLIQKSTKYDQVKYTSISK